MLRGKVLWRTLFFKGTISLIFSFRAHKKCIVNVLTKNGYRLTFYASARLACLLYVDICGLFFRQLNDTPTTIHRYLFFPSCLQHGVCNVIEDFWRLKSFCNFACFSQATNSPISFSTARLMNRLKSNFCTVLYLLSSSALLAIIEWNVHFLIRWRLGKYCTYLQKNHKR